MRWVGGCLGCLLSCPSLALWLSFCKISSTFPWRSLCPCGFGSLSGLGWCVRGCQASHMLRRGVGLWFVFSLGFSLKHSSGRLSLDAWRMSRALCCGHLCMICSVRFLIGFAGGSYSSWVTGRLIGSIPMGHTSIGLVLSVVRILWLSIS